MSTPSSSAPLETSHVRAVSDPALRKIKDEISFFALHGVTASPVTRGLLDALKAYETNAERENGEYSAYDLARDAAEACKLAMMGGNARQRWAALDCARALTSGGALRGRCETWVDVEEGSSGCGVREVGDALACAELLAVVCGCAGTATVDGANAASAGDAESRRAVGMGVVQVLLAACAGAESDEVTVDGARGEADDVASTSTSSSSLTAFSARGDALMQSIRTVFHVAMIGEDETLRGVAKTALTQIINAAFKRAEPGFATEGPMVLDESTGEPKSGALRDVLNLLLTLCKIAAREGPVDQDAYLTHSKALALDILRQLLEGPRASIWLERFHAQLRQPLSVALMRNALLQVPPGSEAEQSIGILVSIARMAYGTLVVRGRAHWKQQVAALYPMMALHPLESGEVSPAMRIAALRLVRRLASDSQVLVDVFVNYDCDLHADNLYERTMMALAQAAQVMDILERDAVLTCLFSMLRSLQSWHARGEGSGENEEKKEQRFSDDGFDGELRPVTAANNRRPPVISTPKSPIGTVAVAAAAATVPVLDADGAQEDEARGDDEVTADQNEDSQPSTPSSPAAGESEAIRFQKAKKTKVTVEKAVEAFNAKPSPQALADATRSNDPEQSAAFLRDSSSRLSPGAIGELLGSPDAESMAIMRAYVHGFDFTSLTIDDALRVFLGGFKLPGEAQKIDRLMEAFAARFCACNHDAFPSTDAAYILAFAIVMLNTDAHNPLTDAALKMSEQDFVIMATAAEATNELDADAVAGIYARVVANEIKMHAADPTTSTNKSSTSKPPSTLTQVLKFAAPWRHRSTLKEASDETASLLEATKAMFKRVEESGADEASSALFVQASEPGLARPMLDAAGKYMLMALSIAFEAAPDEAHAAMPLEGARAMLSLATSLQLPMLRDDICSFLVSAPGFGRPQGIALQSKEALSTLLELAASESSLGGVQAWASVLEVVARLEHLRAIIGAGVTIDTQATRAVFREPLRMQDVVAASEAANGVVEQQIAAAERAVEQWLVSHGGEAIERVFALSTRFDSDEILAYASAVASVSRAELWNLDRTPHAPGKIFALLRLAEIAATNMTRVRLVWSKLWNVVAEHLVESVKHPDDKVVLHATDSLRQVANRLLIRAQSTRASTQLDAMRPFTMAMKNAQNDRARDMVTSCVVQLVKGFSGSLGAGWEPSLETMEEACAGGTSFDVDASAEALRTALLFALENGKPLDADDEDHIVIPFDCVPRAANLLVALARRAGGADVNAPLDAVDAVLAACRTRLSQSTAGANEWTREIWKSSCAALGELARSDDRALDILLGVLDADDVERFDAQTWDHLREHAVEMQIGSKSSAVRASERIIPRLISIVGRRKAAYDALLPTIWSFISSVIRSNDARVIPAAIDALKSAVGIVIARERGGDDQSSAWDAVCDLLRAGVVLDTVMLDLPNAGQVVSRSLACVAACDDLCKLDAVPSKARDNIFDVMTQIYDLARRENDTNGGFLTRLEFASGDALLRSLDGDDARRERFLRHASKCLVIEPEARAEVGPSKDVDASLRMNALAPSRERLAARALAAVGSSEDFIADASARAIALLRRARGAPTSEALADFFGSDAVLKKLEAAAAASATAM